MRRILLTTCALSILRICAAQTTFEQTYGGPESDLGFSVQQTSDGGYALFGSTWNGGAGSADMFLVKVDDAGVEQWSRTYGTVNFDMGYCARQNSDGGFILCGMQNGLGNDSLKLVRTDDNGDTLWTNTYPGTLGRDIAYSVQQTGDGGFVVCGFTEGTGVGEDVYLLRTEANGETLWTRTIDLGGSEVGWSLRQTADDGTIVVANSFTVGDPNGEIHLLRFDTNGDTLWTRTILAPGPDETHGLSITADGGFIIAGGNGYPSRDILLVRTDANGMEQWRRTIATAADEMAADVQPMDDGGFILCGRKENLLTTHIEMHLFRTDADGYVEWERTFLHGVLSEAHSLDRTSDGGFVLFGYTADVLGGNANIDMYLVKTNDSGFSSVRSNHEDLPVISTFPNPATDKIQLDAGSASLTSIALLDASGQVAMQQAYRAARTATLNVGSLANGAYVLTALTEDGRTTRQIVVVAR